MLTPCRALGFSGVHRTPLVLSTLEGEAQRDSPSIASEGLT